MWRLVGFVMFLLALGTLRVVGCGDESPCGDCNDGNPCTRDFCDSYNTSGTISCDPEDISYRCEHAPLPDGTSCDIDGNPAFCVRGLCEEAAGGAGFGAGGGGISNSGALALTNSTVSGNAATDIAAGGIFNGGPTETHALLLGSPAINQIPVEDCLDAVGEPRPETGGTMCDVGLFELQPP